MRHKILSILFLFLVFSGNSQTGPFQKKFAVIDSYIDSLMKEWNIPGLALGIVYGDQLIYGKGYGYRDLENKLPVQPTTIFPIASNTKLFTATVACMLANENKLDLDKPVRTLMPSLNFFNDELNARVTLRDMLAHRTGLPTYNGIWIASPFSRKETVEKIVYMKPQTGFREGYIYNNMMFAAAGAVMENITGNSWEEITRNRIFAPLQMKSSFFTNEEMIKTGNYSSAYFEPDSTRNLKKINYVAQSDALGPAGTIKSNIEDMSHWMIMQLNNGKYKGQQVVPESAIRETLIPNSIADREGKWSELSNSLYGLGRTVLTYKGYRITMHTGSIDGYYSNLTFLPSERLGIFIVHNSQPAGSIRSVMTFLIIDRLLGITKTNWSARYRNVYLKDKADALKSEDSLKAAAIKNTIPSHPLRDFAGWYQNPIYGDINIEWQNDQLFMVFRTQRSKLLHYHYDQFLTDEQMTGRPDFRLNFLTNSRGEIGGISFRPFGDPLAEFVKITK